MVQRNIWDMVDKMLARIEALEKKSKGQWISVTREDGKEKRFRVDGVYDVRFSPNDILICLSDIGWKETLFFSLPTSNIRNAQEGDSWDWDVVAREELEKLRIKLQAVTENHQREDIKKDGSV